jgi:hypothetical protein
MFSHNVAYILVISGPIPPQNNLTSLLGFDSTWPSASNLPQRSRVLRILPGMGQNAAKGCLMQIELGPDSAEKHTNLSQLNGSPFYLNFWYSKGLYNRRHCKNLLNAKKCDLLQMV